MTARARPAHQATTSPRVRSATADRVLRTRARITFDVSQGEDTFGLIARVANERLVQVVSLIRSSQNDLPVCVVRITGAGVEEMLDDLWKSGHRVINVLRH